MTRSQPATNGTRLAKNILLYLGFALALIVALPCLVGLAYLVRILIPAMIVATLVVVAVSPRFRSWFIEQADNSPDYHGVLIPTASLRAHPAHAWVKVEKPGEAKVGVDALAARVLGPITSIEPPRVAARVEQGQTLFTLSSGGRMLAVKSPASGIVARINSDAIARPAAMAESPYGAGWIAELEGVDLGREPVRLLGGSSLRRWFRSEVDRLTSILSASSTAPAMADGGILAKDLASHIDETKWAEVKAKLFENPTG